MNTQEMAYELKLLCESILNEEVSREMLKGYACTYLNIINKNDLLSIWNEIEEAICSLETLTDPEIIENKEAITTRLKNALHCVGKYVSEDDVNEI